MRSQRLDLSEIYKHWGSFVPHCIPSILSSEGSFPAEGGVVGAVATGPSANCCCRQDGILRSLSPTVLCHFRALTCCLSDGDLSP
jgi:hypothetical protein